MVECSRLSNLEMESQRTGHYLNNDSILFKLIFIGV